MTKRKASPVSRSVYQKVAEENKKLLKDIELLVGSRDNAQTLICMIKWKKHFREKEELNQTMKRIAGEYFARNSDKLPKSFIKAVQDRKYKKDERTGKTV